MQIIIPKTVKEKIAKGFQDIPYFAKEFLGAAIHKGQAAWLRASRQKSFGFLHTGNRWGKGETAVFKGAWFAFYKPAPQRFQDKEICLLNTSISQDQANIVLNKFEQYCAAAPKFSWLIKDIKRSPFPHIIFKNKVIWWFRNAAQEGRFLLGRSYLWVNIDEADFAPNLEKLVEEIIEPRVWDYGGAVDCMTTPKGKRNAYRLKQKREKQNDPSQNVFMRGDTRDNHFIAQKQLLNKIQTMSPRLVSQNVEGRFVEAGGLISEAAIQKAHDIATGLLDDPEPGARYINAWDLARRSTFCTRITISIEKPLQVVSFDRFREKADARNPEYWQSVLVKIEEAAKIWPGRTAIDKTGLGDPIFEFLKKTVKGAVGFDMGTGIGIRLKHAIMQNGVSMVSLGKVGIPWIEQITDDGTWTMEDELRDLEENTRGLIWDAVCALFIGLYLYSNPSNSADAAKTPRGVVGAKGASRYGA